MKISSRKKKIILAFGTRPEAIKMAPIYHELKKHPSIFEVYICVTAQHRNMLDQVLSMFSIVPNIDFDLMKKEQDLTDITSSVLVYMRDVIKQYNPDAVLVHGDTTTAMAISMSCFYLNVSVGHVEAGLRTHNIISPFPEEYNRQIISKVARWSFCPTKENAENLLNEQVCKENIFITGNTVTDALSYVVNKIRKSSKELLEVKQILSEKIPFDWENNKFVLITAHRRENFGKGIKEICKAIKILGKKFPKVYFVYPVHPNPNIKDIVFKELANIKNICLTTNLSYKYFVWLMKHAYFILTDSGGIQEEAPSLRKPVLVMRSETERKESIIAGTCVLVGNTHNIIVKKVSEILEDTLQYKKMLMSFNPYGDGKVAKKIVSILKNEL